MEIQTIPGYEADEITVVYRRKIDGSKAIRVLPQEESQKLLAGRTYRKSGRVKSDGEYVCPFCDRKFETANGNFTHQQWYDKNPNKSAKRPRGENVGAANPAAARKFIKDLLKCPYCQKKCKNERGLGVHKASCDQNPNRKIPSESSTPAPQWSDEDDLYLADHFKDSILSLLEHFNRPEREIRQRIDHLKKTGLIKEDPQAENLSLPGHMKKALNTLFGRQPEDNTPIEIGQKVWDFKYHEGEVRRLEETRQCAIVFFPSIAEERKFNYDGIRRMIKAWKEKQEPGKATMGVANG
jgi:hypothetical protein